MKVNEETIDSNKQTNKLTNADYGGAREGGDGSTHLAVHVKLTADCSPAGLSSVQKWHKKAGVTLATAYSVEKGVLCLAHLFDVWKMVQFHVCL